MSELRSSRKCVQCEPSCSVSTHVTNLTVSFRNFTNASKNINCHLELGEFVRRATTCVIQTDHAYTATMNAKYAKVMQDVGNKLYQWQLNRSWTHTRGHTTQNIKDCFNSKVYYNCYDDKILLHFAAMFVASNFPDIALYVRILRGLNWKGQRTTTSECLHSIHFVHKTHITEKVMSPNALATTNLR